MTKHDLKEMMNLGAELGAAKAENDRLRGLLEAALYYVPSNKSELRTLIDNALSQKAEPDCVACEGRPAACNNPCALCGKQAEPTDTYTAVDMINQSAQGFRDGQAATVKDCLTVQPMAYAVFAANGNVVCFSTRRDHPSLVALEADGHSVVSLAPIAQTAPQPEHSGLVEMVDRAMVEMRNIHPPMRRSDCERLIRAAMSTQGAGDTSA